MEQRYLIDTNVIIDLAANRLPQEGKRFVSKLVDSSPSISIINKIELLGFSHISQPVVEFVDFATVLPLDDAIANQSIFIRKHNNIKLPDAIIAATAIIHRLPIVTRNLKDFGKIDQLELVNPYNIIK